ncbi:MAG: IS481 family transposase [Thermoanaerobaculia bacterium]|nr:IS481 family transposase [Thermoanaerobaculia bacterium]
MAWRDTDPVKERIAFIEMYQKRRYTMVELCELFDVSRKTGYKYVKRFEEEGWKGLADRACAAHTHPNQTDPAVADLIVELRREKPRWGAEKILAYLVPRHPEITFPAISTTSDIIRREGLIVPRRKRRKIEHPGKPAVGPITSPNELHNVDFKGQFKTLDGKLCYPLTLTDTFSRALLLCEALDSPTLVRTQKALEKVFRETGLPVRIRFDNGPPFASSRSLAGLSRLGVWLTKLGIEIIRTRPGHPQDNAVHERMHRTLKEETALPPSADLRSQQRSFDAFQLEYNQERPHQALGGQTPASLYSPSSRSLPRTIPPMEYPPHFQVRKANEDGRIKWRGQLLFVSESLRKELIGFEETAHGIWRVYFGTLSLGLLDEREMQIVDPVKGLKKQPRGNVENE